jgi:hypothetical protein
MNGGSIIIVTGIILTINILYKIYLKELLNINNTYYLSKLHAISNNMAKDFFPVP